MKHKITQFDKLRWAVNEWLIRHTSKRVLRKFRDGQYQDFITRDDPRPKGWLRWRRVRRLINRCLDCGYYIKSHQELNIDPLGQTFLETYGLYGGKSTIITSKISN